MNFVLALVFGVFFGFSLNKAGSDKIQQDRECVPLHGYGSVEVHDDGIGRCHERTVCSAWSWIDYLSEYTCNVHRWEYGGWI